MKKILFMALLALASAGIKASTSADGYDYPFLTFRAADGTTTSVSAESLTLTVSGGLLVVENGETRMTLTLAELCEMYFADASTGISSVPAGKTSDGIEVFTLTGTSVGRFGSLSQAKTSLASGIYVVKTNEGIQKIAVK